MNGIGNLRLISIVNTLLTLAFFCPFQVVSVREFVTDHRSLLASDLAAEPVLHFLCKRQQGHSAL